MLAAAVAFVAAAPQPSAAAVAAVEGCTLQHGIDYDGNDLTGAPGWGKKEKTVDLCAASCWARRAASTLPRLGQLLPEDVGRRRKDPGPRHQRPVPRRGSNGGTRARHHGLHPHSEHGPVGL